MERTSLFYMANLGSEINRIFTLKEKGSMNDAEAAHRRADDIIEKLLSHPELAGRAGEIKLLKNYLEQSILREDLASCKSEWQGYFTPYATRLFSQI